MADSCTRARCQGGGGGGDWQQMAGQAAANLAGGGLGGAAGQMYAGTAAQAATAAAEQAASKYKSMVRLSSPFAGICCVTLHAVVLSFLACSCTSTSVLTKFATTSR